MKKLKMTFRDETLPLETRLDLLLEELTLEEKVGLLPTITKAIPRLGIESFTFGAEAAHGVEARCDQDYNRGTPVATTVFTQPIGMSATWDPQLLTQAGEVCGIEARAVATLKQGYGLSRFAPTIDMERDPRWGRTEEAYGEDPYLTGKMASAYIRGMQGDDPFYLRIAATIKHFYANNVEADRIHISSSVDIRNKMEYYLEPFRRAVVEGRAEAMMTAYNEINGIPAICDTEVQKIVKDTWGLSGHVLCDGGDFLQTVEDHHYCDSHAVSLALSMHAGIDAFTDSPEEVIKAADEALIKGYITVADVDRAIRNTLKTRFRLGQFDEHPVCPYASIDETSLRLPEHTEVCRKIGEEAMILLKNDKGMLPLKAEGKKIAVIGPWADAYYKDWYSGVPEHGVTPYEGICSRFGDQNISMEDGLDRVVIRYEDQYLCVGEDQRVGLSNRDDADVWVHTDWGWGQHTFVREKNGMYLSTDTSDDSVRASKQEAWGFIVKEVFQLRKIPGQGKQCYELLNWNGERIGLSSDEHLVVGGNNQGRLELEMVSDGMKKAVEAAKNAELVIAALGANPMINSKEEIDRKDLQFIPKQRELLQQIYAVNPNTVLLLISNYPYILDWEQEHIPAILLTASGNQELGHVAAGALAGDYSPAGRLNMTWYCREEDLPEMNDYDIIRGKRTYQYFDGPVQYPFGYGLSYSKFDYSGFAVRQEKEAVNVSLTVTNIGSMAADEVVQLYVRQNESRTSRPNKQLKGFHRITLQPQESRQVTFTVPVDELKYFDVVSGKMIVEDSTYTWMAGASSEDIRCSETVKIDGALPGTRDMEQYVICDYYDDVRGLILTLGPSSQPALTCLEKLQGGTAVYRDAWFHTIPKKVCLEVQSETMGSVRMMFDGVEVMAQTFCEVEEFESIVAAIDTAASDMSQPVTVSVELFGDIALAGFQFLG